jgi:predicted amidophosphoribosyltransferase
MEVKPGHEKHLCKMVVGDQVDIEDLKPLVRNAKYICSSCGRAAAKAENLCAPVPL